MVTMALLGTLFFGWNVAGLPFVPFDVFDWLTRILPGPLIALGIGTMVSVIRTLHLGPTAETAKLAEQLTAIVVLFIAGVVGGALLYVVLCAVRRPYGIRLGLVVGIAIGVPASLISSSTSLTSSVGPAAERRVGSGSVSRLGNGSRLGSAAADGN
jgi:hypothetical protein